MSLSELLFGIFLSSFIGTLLLSQYASLSHSSKQQHELLMRQFEQNLLTDLLRDCIGQAGFLPCGSQSSFEIWDASQSRWINKKALNVQSNQMIAHYMDTNFHTLISKYSHTPVVSSFFGLSSKHSVLLTNCHYHELNRIEKVEKTGSLFKIRLTYPSRFIVDEDSYIGHWHQDQISYRQNALFYGDKKKEQLINHIFNFHITALKKDIIHINWQFKQLPSSSLFIWATNVSTN